MNMLTHKISGSDEENLIDYGAHYCLAVNMWRMYHPIT